MKDFTLKTYIQLIKILQKQDYKFQTFEEFNNNPKERAIILRHDVDRLPANALEMAKLEKTIGINATYYFRIIKESYNKEIILEIINMGHEIGYHYEDIVHASKRLKEKIKKEKVNRRGEELKRKKAKVKSKEVESDDKKYDENELFQLAIELFQENLEKLRKLYPVKTICMHGNPLSKYDNCKLWEKYNYRDFGIIAEPYFDIDFNEVLYLTDTGRRWDGERYNVRDKVKNKARGNRQGAMGKENPKQIQNSKLKSQNSFHSTFDIIRVAEERKLPDKIMVNVHPQRWTNRPLSWLKELLFQNTKNIVKKWFYVKRELNE